MNAPEACHQLELSMWELAEAASLEKQAAHLRQTAATRVSTVHAHFRGQLTEVIRLRSAKKPTSRSVGVPPTSSPEQPSSH